MRSTMPRQIVVEPGLQHRPQHLLHEILQRARVVAPAPLRQRIERSIDRGAVEPDSRPRSAAPQRRRLAVATARGAAPRRSAARRRRRRVGEHHVGLAVDGAGTRRRWRLRRGHRLRQFEHIRSCGGCAATGDRNRRARLRRRSDPSLGLGRRRTAAAAAGATAARRRRRERGGGIGSAALAGLLASSSAMIRRMEARISSIEGSCAFAGWLIAVSRQSPSPESRTSPRSEPHCEFNAESRQSTRTFRYASGTHRHVTARSAVRTRLWNSTARSAASVRRAHARPSCRGPDDNAPPGRRSARRRPSICGDSRPTAASSV